MINSELKFFDATRNFYLIGNNLELSKKLSYFFSLEENKELWKINTHRQDTTTALRNTESIMLRQISISKVMEKLGDNFKNTTGQCNQLMDLEDSLIFTKYDIFQESIKILDNMFKELGATEIDYGRIFFSKFKSKSNIDEHTDKGKYFSYYDRFHFVIETPKECIFHIQEDIHLETGGFYWVNNHVSHWLINDGLTDRINLIVDARLK